MISSFDNRARTRSSSPARAAPKKIAAARDATTSCLAARSPTRCSQAHRFQLFGGVALRQQRDAEPGFDQAFLGVRLSTGVHATSPKPWV